MDKLNYWVNLWESEKKFKRGSNKEFWDSRADYFNSKVNLKVSENEDIIALLKKKNILKENIKVLDIGCGPGKYTLPIAELANEVTAIDISDNMLSHLKNNCEKKGLTNIDIINRDWKYIDLKEYKWEKKYDLVFASMTPGVFNYSTLNKMLEATNNYCYLSGFVKRDDLIGDKINNIILGKSNNSLAYDKVYYSFNILWELGYHPEVHYIDRSWEEVMTKEEAYDNYSKKLEFSKELSLDDKSKIKDIIESEAKDDKIIEKTEVRQGILIWSIK